MKNIKINYIHLAFHWDFSDNISLEKGNTNLPDLIIKTQKIEIIK